MSDGTSNFQALCAGAARADITPSLGTQLAGDIGRCRPTEEIRDRLYANALVAELKLLFGETPDRPKRSKPV